MKLLIHAGIHRTGTSSLQDYLAANRGPMMERGIAYPGDGKNHQQLAWAIKRGEAGAADVLGLVRSVGPAAHTVVLSAEDFCIHQDLAWLAETAREIPTTAYFYLRRQDHWVMSWYNQHVKWPFDGKKSQMDPEEFLRCIGEFHWIDFSSLIRRWEAVLGWSGVKVSVIEADQVQDVTAEH